MSIIEVAAGLVFLNGKLLIAQRYADSHLGGLWEFPGGKREPQETFQKCLIRELEEELGIQVQVGVELESVQHAYPEKTVLVKFFICRLLSGNPQPIGCAAVKWVSDEELRCHSFPAADSHLLKTLQGRSDLWKLNAGSEYP